MATEEKFSKLLLQEMYLQFCLAFMFMHDVMLAKQAIESDQLMSFWTARKADWATNTI